MTLVRYEPLFQRNPWAGLARMQQQMNRLFDNLSDGDETLATWAPRVSVVDLDDHFEVTAELPGMKQEDVKVELHNNVLSISGEKKDELEKQERNVYLCERSFGTFRRTFQLPSQLDPNKISAEFKHGVLTVSLPKVEEAKPKQIDIKVS